MNESRQPRIVLFVGPTIRPAELRAVFDKSPGLTIPDEVTILPPIQQGDLLKLLSNPPDVVGIIDGYFFQVPSVLHKEILLLMERGTQVLGAASLGALRAAELERFGMKGVGAIYGMYRRGAIDGDHEVAVLHAEAAEDYRPLTEPLVNVRHNLQRARRRGIISARAGTALLAWAKRCYFAELTYDALVAGAAPDVVTDAERTALRQFLRDEAVDLKREDALALARYILVIRHSHYILQDVRVKWNVDLRCHSAPPVRTHVTRYFGDYLREYVGQPADGLHVPDRLVLAFQKLLDPTFQRVYERAARRCLALEEARASGLADGDPPALVARFRQSRGLEPEDAFASWLRARYLSPDELTLALGERDLELRLLTDYRARHAALRGQSALYRQLQDDVTRRLGVPVAALAGPPLAGLTLPWDGPLLREMKLRGAYGPALERAARILRFTAAYAERNPHYPLARLKCSRLEAWCAARWGVDVADLGDAIRAHGFASDAEFDEAARHVYAWERFSRPQASPDLR